jgi:tRNA (Guanine-1)-methyltransferase.
MASPRGGKLEGPFAKKADAKPEDGEVIYLSSDSANTLHELKPYDTYIIGGLVDKNRHKAICYKSALEAGVKTAKLPIGDYIQMSSRAVMTTNHVVDIMLAWLECGDWGEAFMKIMPQRKGGKLREAKGGAEDAGAEEDEQEEEEEDDETTLKRMNDHVEEEQVNEDEEEEKEE